MKKCILPNCGNDIPDTRKKSSKYCSDDCYYEAKKTRSSNKYRFLKAPFDKIKRMEEILAFFYQVDLLKKKIFFEDLQKMQFDWGFATRDVTGPEKQICKVIGSYCYYLNKDNSVSIWKLKSKT